jgi:hypothetical protein
MGEHDETSVPGEGRPASRAGTEPGGGPAPSGPPPADIRSGGALGKWVALLSASTGELHNVGYASGFRDHPAYEVDLPGGDRISWPTYAVRLADWDEAVHAASGGELRVARMRRLEHELERANARVAATERKLAVARAQLAAATGPGAAAREGRCGAERPRTTWEAETAPCVFCALPAAHLGWHQGEDGSEWTLVVR